MHDAEQLNDPGPFPEMRCKACGSSSVGYDVNPHNLPVIHTCLMGCKVTGEPGAERCNDCGSLDVEDVC
jgi:hypothetical protein